jgi:hypothetical protein
MTNWTEILQNDHKRFHEDDGVQLVLGPPATPVQLEKLDAMTSFSWPKEFRELYACHDGVGLVLPGEAVEWSFVPTSELVTFGDTVRGWFADTHPEIARAFHPFFNWGSGDSMGFLESDSYPIGTVFLFEHEFYRFSNDQNWVDFLIPSYHSILSFIKP